METTTGLLERTAQRMVADLDPVEAVVLFGSRAGDTARASSHRDIAELPGREQVLAATWERPNQAGEQVVDNDLIRGKLKMASSGVAIAMQHASIVLAGDDELLKVVSRRAQHYKRFCVRTLELSPNQT